MGNRPHKAQKPKFSDPQYFTYDNQSKKWFCNICSLPSQGERDAVSAQAAMKHEKSAAHTEKLSEMNNAWGYQPDIDAWMNTDTRCGLYENKVAEHMDRVDQLGDIIPFWREQVEAANHGVELRFEDFLNSLARTREEGLTWDAPIPDWAGTNKRKREECGSTSHVVFPPANWSSAGSNREAAWAPIDAGHDGSPQEDFMFVEEVALRCSVDQERKKRLHAFYKISTNEKIEKIEQLIKSLKAA